METLDMIFNKLIQTPLIGEKEKQSITNSYNNLILFGHNSAITDFVNKFGDIFIDNVPTSGFVSIKFDCDSWETINKGKTDKIIFPRDI